MEGRACLFRFSSVDRPEFCMVAYRISISEHHDRWHRYQSLAAGAAGLFLIFIMLGVMVMVADRRAPAQHLPWRPLELANPIGLFTREKLVQAEGGVCRSVLAQGGVAYQDVEDQASGEFCTVRDGVRLTGGLASLRPAGAVMTCNQALAFSLWERQVVQTAAARHFGSAVTGIQHYGSYSCRRRYGAKDGPVSEHASANALDIAAFTLADGRKVSVEDHWSDAGEKGAFLREIRDGACDLFGVTLSPDYNAAHRDHLHLDMGQGGVCR